MLSNTDPTTPDLAMEQKRIEALPTEQKEKERIAKLPFTTFDGMKRALAEAPEIFKTMEPPKHSRDQTPQIIF